MLQIHLGATPHQLNSSDFHEIAKKTEGYSGSDIAVVVREALMMPVRMVQDATHFKEIQGVDRLDSTKPKTYLTPCSPGDPNGKEMTWIDINGDDLLEPQVTKKHFNQSLYNTRPTVNQGDLEKYINFTKEFGQEG